jgi:LysR family glycine cleavage system transcriptional activator
VALGRAPLIERYLKTGELVAPFRDRVTVSRKYFVLVAPHARERPCVRRFVEWLLAEAAAGAAGTAAENIGHGITRKGTNVQGKGKGE